jgi:hypothetical protein
MGIKVGDQVKFLNATGGGVVRKIIDSRLVTVAIEGGFEIPVQASELVVIDPVGSGSKFFNESFEMQDTSETTTSAEHISGSPEDLPGSVIDSKRSEDIFVVFVPHDQKWLITGFLDVFLVNNTSYDLLYNYFRKNDSDWSGIDYGSMGAGTRLLIATIQRDDLPLWTDGCFQFLFHKERCFEVPRPFNIDFSITGKKFYTKQNYRDSMYVTGKGILLKIATISMNTDIKEPNKPTSALAGKTTVNTDEFILRHNTGDKEAEVDLHIDELVDDPSVFEKVEILEYQKNYFVRCLESAIANGFLKVTFIHGVGNGILREVLMDYLKKQEGIEVFDAPMQKYGVGAIEVHIMHNR